jgi:putative ABC transport system substrate-binding protein
VDRRAFISGITLGLLAAPLAAEAQPMRKVAFLCPGPCSALPNVVFDVDRAFVTGLERGGYVFGRNASLDVSGVGVGHDRLPEAARTLVHRKVDVILTVGNEATRLAREATNSTPIVMLNVADAVEEGLVASLGRPGANVTGVSVPLGQIAAKRIEFLREINPRLTRVAALWHSSLDQHVHRTARLERVAAALGVQLSGLGVATFRDLDQAFGSTATRPDGLLLFESVTGALGREITLFALQHRIPTAGPDRLFVQGGGLLAYGPHMPDLYERAASYASNILKGARPSGLPVEQPTRFELIISKGAAGALGLTIPPSLLQRADQVIE